jgi:chemotaxis methyl-accepting protein methylase
MSQERLQRFFLKGKASNAGMVRVKPELRRLIDFMSVNLIRDDWPFKEPFDVVFCRNVMIYFDAATQRRVLEKFIESLSLEGFYLWDMRKILASLKTCLSCAEKRFTSGADSVW